MLAYAMWVLKHGFPLISLSMWNWFVNLLSTVIWLIPILFYDQLERHKKESRGNLIISNFCGRLVEIVLIFQLCTKHVIVQFKFACQLFLHIFLTLPSCELEMPLPIVHYSLLSFQVVFSFLLMRFSAFLCHLGFYCWFSMLLTVRSSFDFKSNIEQCCFVGDS